MEETREMFDILMGNTQSEKSKEMKQALKFL